MPDKQFACRPDSMIGSWYIDQSTLDAYEAQAITIITEGKLEAVAAKTAEQVEAQRQNPYELDEHHGIATFNVSGPLSRYPNSFQSLLGGTSTLMLQHALATASRDPKVRAGFILGDSPGGTVMGTAEAADAIKKFRHRKPLYTHIAGSGTSAMYWLAVASSYLSADPTAYIGSVGTMAVLTDRTKQLANMGITKHAITNPDATRKAVGVDGTAVTDQNKAEIRTILQHLTEPFAAAVKAERDLPDSVMDDVKKGGVYIGNHAFDLRLVDAIGFTTDAYENLISDLAKRQ